MRIEEALAEAEAAPLSTRKARLCAALLDDFCDRAWEALKVEPERAFGAEDVLTFRARLRAVSPAMAAVMALAENRSGGPRLEIQAVAVASGDYPTLSVQDFMVSLYNGLTVMRVMLVEAGGATQALPILREAAAWWRDRV